MPSFSLHLTSYDFLEWSPSAAERSLLDGGERYTYLLNFGKGQESPLVTNSVRTEWVNVCVIASGHPLKVKGNKVLTPSFTDGQMTVHLRL